jgi:hypothetical protein
VFVYDEALAGPAGGAEVELRLRGTEKPFWHGRTDATGYVLATAPEQGLATVQLRGAPTDDEDARAVLQLEATSGEAVVVLAEAEPRMPCTFALDSTIPVAAGVPPPAVILHRVDPGRHCVRRLAPALLPGRSEHRVDLPYGTFAVTPLPQGCAELGGGKDLVEVAVESSGFHEVRLAPCKTRRLELTGLAATDFPVQLRVFEDDDLLDTAEDRIWLGPMQWRRRAELVPGWPGPVRLFARGRGAVWISDSPVPPGVQVVTMQAAAEIEVLAPPGRGLVAEVTCAGSTCARMMRSAMVATQHGKRPFLRAVLAAPAGSVNLVVRRPDGTEIFRETRDARGRELVVVP